MPAQRLLVMLPLVRRSTMSHYSNYDPRCSRKVTIGAEGLPWRGLGFAINVRITITYGIFVEQNLRSPLLLFELEAAAQETSTKQGRISLIHQQIFPCIHRMQHEANKERITHRRRHYRIQ
jgi:hypothetical protein